jgi:hypothetical protein
LAPGTVVAQLGEVADYRLVAGVTLGGNESELVDSGLMGWKRVPPRRLVAERLGIPCLVKNDVAALTYSHRCWRRARRTGLRAPDRRPGRPHVPGRHRGCASSFLTARSLLMATAQGMGRFPAYQEILRLATDGRPADRLGARRRHRQRHEHHHGQAGDPRRRGRGRRPDRTGGPGTRHRRTPHQPRRHHPGPSVTSAPGASPQQATHNAILGRQRSQERAIGLLCEASGIPPVVVRSPRAAHPQEMVP